MDKKSNGEKAAFGLTKEEFYKILEQKRSQENSSFEDPALEQFVKEPSESDLCDNFKLKPYEFLLLTFLLSIMLSVSIISGNKGEMESYVAIPIAILSFLGLLILIKRTKEHDEENTKRYK